MGQSGNVGSHTGNYCTFSSQIISGKICTCHRHGQLQDQCALYFASPMFPLNSEPRKIYSAPITPIIPSHDALPPTPSGCSQFVEESYKITHFAHFIVGAGRGLSTALCPVSGSHGLVGHLTNLMASSNTLLRFRCVRAEHSKYLTALISFATASACS
jgi:hypothetical protein